MEKQRKALRAEWKAELLRFVFPTIQNAIQTAAIRPDEAVSTAECLIRAIDRIVAEFDEATDQSSDLEPSSELMSSRILP